MKTSKLKMSERKKSVLLMLLMAAAWLVGCASAPQVPRETVLQQNEAIAKLAKRLDEAEAKDIGNLAPEGFTAAKTALEEAIAQAQQQHGDLAAQSAEQGAKRLDRAEADAVSSRVEYEEVLTNRERANKAGAPSLYAQDYQQTEEKLRKATALIEQNQLEKAKQRRPELIDAYAKLELKALKESTIRKAQTAFQLAQNEKADKYAPKTLKRAEEELHLALSVLEANRNDQQKSDVHAVRAIELANQSAHISELIKDFERRDFTQEDVVLWYQQQLTTVLEPMSENLRFDRDNRSTVLGMREAVSLLTQTNQQNQAKIDELMTAKQQEIGQLKKQYEQEISTKAEQEKIERELQERFEYVQSLFNRSEATVYRQRQNVLLTVQGFYFAPGKTDIEARNFPLLNKINDAVKKFPGAYVVISGHTDSTGDAKINMSLSEQRAANVAKFLVDTAGGDPGKITARGYGEEKPIASNKSEQGRAQNRRVEVLIINPDS